MKRWKTGGIVMAKRMALRTRIARLEKSQLRKPWKRKIVFAIGDGVPDNYIVGMASSYGRVHVPRMASEPLQAFTRRAAGIIPSNFLFRVYSTPSSASAAESDVEDAPSAA